MSMSSEISEWDSPFLRKMKGLKGANSCRSSEKPKKSIIYAVEMYCKEKEYYDKVNYYVYDEKKFGEIWKKSLSMLESIGPLDMYKENNIILEKGVVLEPISSMPDCRWVSYIVFESCLFRIGGSYYSTSDALLVMNGNLKDDGPGFEYYLREASNKVGILDLKNIDKDWTKGPEMNSPRRGPHLFILKGKLYVAGGIFTTHKEVIKKFVFMEVLENETWKALPNHPRFLDEKTQNPYLLSKVVIGAIEEEGFIIAGVGMDDYEKDYCFYTYKPEDAVPKWEPYIKISNDLHANMMIQELFLKPAVVSGKLMLWLCYELPNTIYIMDFENDTTMYLDLVKNFLVPTYKSSDPRPMLIMLEEGKFCLFWLVGGYFSGKYMSGTEVYFGLHSTVFTLKIVDKKPIVEVISSKFSITPDLLTHSLQAICIADIDDSMQLTPFDY